MYKTFSELLGDYMVAAHVSTLELARQIHTNRHTIMRWRKGETARPDCSKVRACQRPLRLSNEQARQLLLAAGCGSVVEQPVEIEDSLPLSPFVVGPPITHPSQFCGRTPVVARILSLWSKMPLQNVAIIGGRRLGKSSLVHYLYKTIPQKNSLHHHTVLIDFKEPRMRNRASLLQHLLTCLSLPVLSQCSLIQFEELLAQNPLARPTLFLMDDIEYGLAAEELDQDFWWGLRSVQQNYVSGRMGFLMTSRQTPAELAEAAGKSSPFFNVFGHQVQLAPFTVTEAEQLLARSPIPFPTTEQQWMIAHCAGMPECLQRCATELLCALERGEHSQAWRAQCT